MMTAATETSVIRVLVADDHPVVRMGLTGALGAQADIEVVGEASDIDSLMAQVADTTPDVIVLDLELEAERNALAHLRAHGPAEARVIIYTAHDEVDSVVEAVKIGVQGYLRKSTSPGDLIAAIRSVDAGGTVLEPDIATKLVQGLNQQRVTEARQGALTKRELQVLRLVGEGKSNCQIGSTLFISERTVKYHVSALLAKLNARNRTEAILTATRLGILRHPTEVG